MQQLHAVFFSDSAVWSEHSVWKLGLQLYEPSACQLMSDYWWDRRGTTLVSQLRNSYWSRVQALGFFSTCKMFLHKEEQDFLFCVCMGVKLEKDMQTWNCERCVRPTLLTLRHNRVRPVNILDKWRTLHQWVASKQMLFPITVTL